jgi:hypothetical protein
MELHREGLDLAGLLSLVTFHDLPVPEHQGVLVFFLRVLVNLGLGGLPFSFGDYSPGQFDPLDVMDQRHVGVHFLFGAFIGFVPRGHDAPSDFAQAVHSTEFPHAFFGRHSKHQMRRLIAGRSAPAEDVQSWSVFCAEGFSHLVPIVGVHGRAALDLLGYLRSQKNNTSTA